MNTKTTSLNHTFAQHNPREGLQRIRRISRYLKVMILFCFVIIPGLAIVGNLIASKGPLAGFYWKEAGPDSSPVYPWAAGISTAISLGMAVTFYLLLNGFERGTFFSTTNVRLLRWLGNLAFANGLLLVILPVLESGLFQLTSLLLSVFCSPWVVGGLFVVMISHILEEACKLREEQALTV